MFWRSLGYEPPRRDWERLQREMNRLFAGLSPAPSAAAYPAMNVWANEDGAIVMAELPGMSTDNLDISVVGDTLTLSGVREPEEEVCDCDLFHRQERGFGSFTRSFQLPFQVEAEDVEATYEKGVLRIELPRAESDKPKKITVQAAG